MDIEPHKKDPGSRLILQQYSPRYTRDRQDRFIRLRSAVACWSVTKIPFYRGYCMQRQAVALPDLMPDKSDNKPNEACFPESLPDSHNSLSFPDPHNSLSFSGLTRESSLFLQGALCSNSYVSKPRPDPHSVHSCHCPTRSGNPVLSHYRNLPLITNETN